MPRTNADSFLPPIGWIGLGEMGLPMSANLVAAGHTVYGFDLDPDKRAAAGAAGVQIVDSTAELVERGELLVSMLRTGVQTEALLLGDGGLAELTAGGPRTRRRAG
jgi:3-hydroxyisobutyrate dehydrogenase